MIYHLQTLTKPYQESDRNIVSLLIFNNVKFVGVFIIPQSWVLGQLKKARTPTYQIISLVSCICTSNDTNKKKLDEEDDTDNI